MRTKKHLLLGEEYISLNAKKKHSKLHEFAGQKNKNAFEQNGVVTDSMGNLIRVGSLVEVITKHNSSIEGEVSEIHANNILTVTEDVYESNKIISHKVNSWDVTVIEF